MNEIWKDITGYEGLYQVSNLGRVKSLKYGKERIMKLCLGGDGYLKVTLCKNGKINCYLVHRLVAQAFLENTDNLPCVNHKDEVKTNNRVDNLEFCSYKYNNNYGTVKQRIAEKKINGKTSKKVFQYTLAGELIKVWQSTREIERRLGYDQGNISACCLGKYKQSYGYVWKYKTPE